MPVTVIQEINQVVPDEGNTNNSVPMGIGLMKGDILVYAGEGDIRRLPVGTVDQVLVADPTSELGVKWKTLS